MKLYETVEQQLKKEPNFVTDKGELKKWVVLNKAQNLDEELIGLLLDHAELKEKFFMKIKGPSASSGQSALVFKQNLFVQFLEQKNYLNDCYTQFKNKMGLAGKFLKQHNDVSWNLSQDFDWIIVYTKSTPETIQLSKRAIERRYHKSVDYPKDEWRLSDLTTQRSNVERPNLNFTMINPINGEKSPVNPNRCWSVTLDTFEDFYKRGKIIFPGDYDFLKITIPAMRIFKSEEIEKSGDGFDKTYISSAFLHQAMNHFEAYNLPTGLLINFGARSLQFKRLFNKSWQSKNLKNQDLDNE